MRKILKYIGILLIINWGFRSFAVEKANDQSTVNDVEKFKDLDDFKKKFKPKDGDRADSLLLEFVYMQSPFGRELIANFHHIASEKEKEPEEINLEVLNQKIQDKIVKLQQKFLHKELSDIKCNKVMIRLNENFLIRDENGNPLEDNYFNYLTLYEEAIIDKNLNLYQIFLKSINSSSNLLSHYKDLYKKALDNPDYDKEVLKKEFSDYWMFIIKSKSYFLNNLSCFFACQSMNQAFIQLTFTFSVLKQLLGKNTMGLPEYFNEVESFDEYNGILANLISSNLNTSKKKKKNPDRLRFQKMYKDVSFEFADIFFRIEFIKIYFKALSSFMVSPNFSQWLKYDGNLFGFFHFQSFFLEAIFGVVLLIELIEPLGSVRTQEEIEMTNKILLLQLKIKRVRSTLSHGDKAQFKEKNEIFYEVACFHEMMNGFFQLFVNVFKQYFMNKLLWPSKEEFESMDMNGNKSNQIALTPLEKNTLNLSDKLNIILKAFFHNPSFQSFNGTLFVVNQIKDQFLKLTMDLRLKHHEDEKKIEFSWVFFLKNINPENFDLYNKFITNQDQYHPMSEEGNKKQPEFSKKTIKKMSANQQKRYKEQAKSMENRSQDSQSSQQESMVVSESQQLIFEARENFNNITKNKIDIYNSYKSSIKKVKNTIDICLNLINKKGINEKNQLKSLIKEMDLLKQNTQPLENIKDEINDTQKYEDDSFPIELESSYNLNKINQLIKKENAKVHQFNRIIGLLSEAHDCLDGFISQISQQDMEDTTKIVVFENKKSLYSRATEQEPFHQSGHIPNPKGKPGQEGPTARFKKKKRKNEEVQIAFQDAIDQQKAMEEAQKQLEKQQEEDRKQGAALLKQELQRQAQLKSNKKKQKIKTRQF
jgi:hypothetical protein